MGRRDFKETIRQNAGKKPINPVIIILAFLLGAAAGFAALWRIIASRGKKRAGARSGGTAGRESAQTDRELRELLRELQKENESRERAPHEAPHEAQRMKPYMPRQRKRRGRRVVAAVAAILAIVLVCYNVLQYIGPASTAIAKESFGGIRQIVQDHGEENPFVILDIVPGKALYTAPGGGTYELSLGTIGYFVGGQAPVRQDLQRIFTGRHNTDFYLYADRLDLVDQILGSSQGAFPGITYREGYAGTGESHSASDGWIQVYDSVERETGSTAAVPTGRMYAQVEHLGTAGGGENPGYDYDLSSGTFDGRAVDTLGDENIYVMDSEGEYRVIFGSPVESTSGYRASVLSVDWQNFSDATGAYLWTGTAYRYAGTVKGIKEMFGIYDGEQDAGQEDENREERPDDGNGEGGSGSEDGDSSEGEGDSGSEGGGEGSEGGEGGSGSGGGEGSEGDSGSEGGGEGGEDSEGGSGSGGEGEGGSGSGGGGEGSEGEGSGGGGEGSEGEGGSEGDGDSGSSSGRESGDGGSGDSDDAPPAAETQSTGVNSPAAADSAMLRWYRFAQEGPESAESTPEPVTMPDPSEGTPDPAPTPAPTPDPPEQQPPAEVTPDPVTETPQQPPAEETPDPVPETPDEGTQEPIVTEDDSSYYILSFEYVDQLKEAEWLYQVEDVRPIEAEEGQPRPYDSYALSGHMRVDLAEDMALLAVGTAENVSGVFTYAGAGKGRYKLTRVRDAESAGASGGYADATTGEVYYVEVQNAPVYIRCSGSNDWLKRYVFNSLNKQDNQSSDFTIEVNTVTAGEVTYEMIQDADLVYLEEGSGICLNSSVTKKYIGADNIGSAGGDGSGSTPDNSLRDISEQAISRLIYDTVTDLKPVIVDYGIVTNEQDYKGTNYQKLAKAFLKKDLTSFYEDMSRSDDLAASVLMNVDKDSSEYPNKKDNDYHYVNRNVYIVSGSPLVSEDFAKSFDKDEARAGFEEVLAAIQAENMTLSEEDQIAEKVSRAMAVQYIINFSVGLIGDYKDLTILELQPTANAVSDLHRDVNEDKGNVVLYWQREDREGAGQQILRSSRQIETNVTTRSVAAFNGEYRDINNRYDMIFIGLDGQKLYQKRNKDGDIRTVYNDEDLNGKVYHTGDRAAGSDERYDANDITRQKKEALIDYMRAGYPVVVENDCFKGRSAKKVDEKDINTDYIGQDTMMYSFLKEAISDNGMCIYTIEDVHSSALFMAQLNTVRPKIGLKADEEGADMIATERTGEGNYRGTIEYVLSSDRAGDDKRYPGDLTKRLYLDLDYDGIFTPEEEVQEFAGETAFADGGSVSVDFKEVCFGIVPWKLEVSDMGNVYRRDAIQGYFTIKGQSSATVRVLQVLDDLSIDGANFQMQYEQATNSLLDYYLNGAETLLNMEFKIETVTPAVLEERLNKHDKYLLNWDVLVLGFGNSGHPGGTIATAVNDYIAAGGSAVVSSAGAQADKAGLGIVRSSLGQLDAKTYSALGVHSGEYYRYKGLKNTMFDEFTGLYAENINEGTLSRWPYQLGNTVALGESTSVRAPEYLLDIDAPYRDGQTHTTAWFTLNAFSGTDINAYNVSPEDARNNYYAYSKGNVVYVGQSEYPYIFDASQGENPEDEGTAETMLFVNALMAAYNNGMHPAQLSIVAGFSASAMKIESIAIPFDQEIRDVADGDASVLDDTVDVYFKFTDNNLATDKTRQVSFYYGDEGMSMPSDVANATPFTSEIWTVENNQLIQVAPDALRPGQIYRIKAPVIALKQDDNAVNAKIYVVVQVDFKKSGKDRSTVGADSVFLSRAQLFLLE